MKNLLNLSVILAKISFKLRNEGSFLGILWYLLNPVILFFLIIIIFSGKLGQQIPHYPLYLFLGIIIFNFFQNSTIESSRVFRENALIIKSINFPKEALILGTLIKFTFSHLIEIILFILISFILKVSFIYIVFYPLIFLAFFFFVLGSSFILSSISLYIRDIENIWIFASRVIWFATPIFYSVENKILSFINLLNPLYYFITSSRDIIIYSKMPPLSFILISLNLGLLFFLIGIFIFKKIKKIIPETV